MKNHYEIGSVVFGKWSIARRIGAGSFGTVYEIRREEFDQIYTAALKVITVPQGEMEFQDALDEGMTRSQAEDYFYTMVKDIVREFAIMARLKGTGNVVCYEDHEVVPHDDGTGWDILIRMELLNPLMPYAYGHPLSRRDVIRLGIDMCKALELCQRYNIIHRDIKPENIFVSDNGDFKLGDFGIARTIERTMSGLSKKGTYNYMAPEVYRGSEYGFSVDIYSLGIVLYRLLNNNRAPFLPQPPEPITYSQREAALAKRMGGEELPPPVNGLGRLGEIVLKACAFDPKARYSSPIQMRQELESIQYSPEDGQIIYPSGDELSLYENQYATQKSRAESIAPPEPSDAPAPVAAEVMEKTESVFGGGAVNQDASKKEQENFQPGEETEKTESIFGHSPEKTNQTDAASDAGNGHAEGAKKRRWIAYCMAFIAAIAILIPLSLRKPAKSEIPESLQEYEAAGTLESYEVLNYDGDGNSVRREYYDADGALTSVSEEDNYGRQTRFELYNADGTLDSYDVMEYDGYSKVREENYDGAGMLRFVQEYDTNENCVRIEYYDADGTLKENYGVSEYNKDGYLFLTQYTDGDTLVSYEVREYDENGNFVNSNDYSDVPEFLQEYDKMGTLTRFYSDDGTLETYLAEECDSNGNCVREEQYNADGTLECYWMYEYDSDGNCVRVDEYNADGTLSAMFEYDSNGNCVYGERYDTDGTLIWYLAPDESGELIWYESGEAQ